MYYLVLSWRECADSLLYSLRLYTRGDIDTLNCPLCFKKLHLASEEDVPAMIKHLRRCYCARKLKWNLTETLYNGVKYADNTEVDKYSIVRNVVRNVNDEINDYLDGYLDFGSSDHLY